MKLNVHKIDERLEKLHEIRRIVSDPELVSMLLEFISDDDREEQRPIPAVMPMGKPNAAPVRRPEDIGIVDQVLKGLESVENGSRSPLKG